MKKSAVIAGSLLVVAAAYTGVAWYVGLEAEKTIRAAVEQANQRIVKTLGPDLGSVGATLEIDHYQRGVFSTEARYTFVVQDGDERTELSMQDAMQHGPFPWDLLKEGRFTPLLAYSRSQLVDTDTVKRWFDAARGAMPLTADTRIGFNGEGVTVWELAPLEWVAEEDSLSFSGGKMEARFSNDLRDSEGEGSFGTLVVGNGLDGETVTLKDIRVESRSSTAADESVEVHSTLHVAALVVDDMAAESLALEQVSVAFDSVQKASLLDAALRYDIQRIMVGDIDLGSVSVGGKVARFDFEAFSALLAEYDAIAREHGAQEGEDFDLTPQDEERLLARLVPTLASSPELALQPVSWRNEKGETTLALSLALQPLPDGDAQAQEEALADSLRELRLELALSRPMLLQAISRATGGEDEGKQLEMLAAFMFDAYVERLEEEGLVRREEDRALATVVYSEGMVDVNGREMGVDEFLALLAQFGL